jgi:hypothetical protein
MRSVRRAHTAKRTTATEKTASATLFILPAGLAKIALWYFSRDASRVGCGRNAVKYLLCMSFQVPRAGSPTSRPGPGAVAPAGLALRSDVVQSITVDDFDVPAISQGDDPPG